MGVLESFHAGDSARIASAWAQSEPLEGAPFVRASADFSLHLPGGWLEELTEAVCLASGVPAIDPLGEPILEDDGACAFVVSPVFVGLVAALSAAQLESVAREWLALELTPDVSRAMVELGQLCRIASAERLAVVYVVTA